MRRFARWVYRAIRYGGPRAANAIGRLQRSIRRNQTKIEESQEKFRLAGDNDVLRRLYAIEEQTARDRIAELSRQLNDLTD